MIERIPAYKKKTSSKKHYAVYLCRQGDGVYGNQKTRRLLGETWAASEAQACNNVRYRTSGKTHGYYEIGDYAEEGSCSIFYEAEEI